LATVPVSLSAPVTHSSPKTLPAKATGQRLIIGLEPTWMS